MEIIKHPSDCLKEQINEKNSNEIENRFELVVLAAERARQLMSGAFPQIPKNFHKDTVIALKEIDSSSVSVESLRDLLIKKYQRKKQHIQFEDQPEQFDNKMESAYKQEFSSKTNTAKVKKIQNSSRDDDDDDQ